MSTPPMTLLQEAAAKTHLTGQTKQPLTASVAMCTYNGSLFVRQQLESILDQTLPVGEVMICDDGSSDDTIAIIQSLQSRSPIPIRIFRNQANLGSSRNFQQAIGLCSGNVIFLADQDDIWHRDKVEITLNWLNQHPDITTAFSDGLLIDPDGVHRQHYGTLLGMVFQKEERRMWEAGLRFESFLVRNHAVGATMATRSNFLREADPFALCVGEILHDYAIALRAAETGTLGLIDLPLVDYRRHGHSQTVYTLPSAGQPSIWHTWYDALRELWPTGETLPIRHLLAANHAQERIAYMATRNRDLHRPLAPLAIPFRLKRYRRMYGSRWARIMRYDISQCLRYSWQRLTHRVVPPTNRGEKLQQPTQKDGKKLPIQPKNTGKKL